MIGVERDQINPKIITLEPTEHCAGRCIMCNKWKGTKGMGMGIENYQRVIEQATKLGTKHINVSGGEPLLYPRILTLLQMIKEKGLEAAIVTMGITVRPEMAEVITRAGVDIVRFSLDAPYSHVHNHIRGIPHAFENGIRGINALLQAKEKLNTQKPSVEVNMTVMGLNASYVEEMLDLCNSLGVNRLNYGLVIQVPLEVITDTNKQFGVEVCSNQFMRNEIEQLLLSEGQTPKLRKAFGVVLEKSIKTGLATNADVMLQMLSRIEDVLSGAYLKQSLISGELACPFPSSRLIIDAQGNVFPCSPIRYPLGNIQYQPLTEIWDGESHRKFREVLATAGWAAICYMCCSLKPKVGSF